MPMPEYVFHARIVDFYERMRSGKNLHKLDEVFYFLDEKSLTMTKKWLMDERFPWTIGKGWGLLTQTPPLVAMTLEAESDRDGGMAIGNISNYAGTVYEDTPEKNPIMYFEEHGRLKNARFNFILVAPSSDMISAMYLLMIRALMEGESPPIDEPHIIPYESYGIGELHYSGSDIKPNNEFLPTVAFARTITVQCTYLQFYRGVSLGNNGFASSIDIGNVIT